jgi:hypothetical protein
VQTRLKKGEEQAGKNETGQRPTNVISAEHSQLLKPPEE